MAVYACAFAFAMMLMTDSAHADDHKIDTNAIAPMPEQQQGVIIPCERCVILYPDLYKDHPELCPICHGAKEHFQPAQMMTHEMAEMRLHEIDVEIQDLLYTTTMDSMTKPVTAKQLRKIRGLYMRKLKHLLIYGFLDVEKTAEKIRKLDDMIEMREKVEWNPAAGA